MSSEDFQPLQTPRFRLTEQVKFLLIYQSVYVVLMSLCCFIKRKQMETTSTSTILSTSFLKREAVSQSNSGSLWTAKASEQASALFPLNGPVRDLSGQHRAVCSLLLAFPWSLALCTGLSYASGSGGPHSPWNLLFIYSLQPRTTVEGKSARMILQWIKKTFQSVKPECVLVLSPLNF